MKIFFVVSLVIFSLFISCGKNTGWAQTMENRETFQYIEIEKTIELIDVEKYRKMLIKFKSRFQEDDSFLVTSHSDCFEIIVTHPSQGNYSGGAEQYFLDKKTGESKMGWHEHPMEIQVFEETDKTIE